MEDHGFGIDGEPVQEKVRWYKDKTVIKNIAANIVGGIVLIVFVIVVTLIFNFAGECSVRNRYIKSCENVVVTGIHDNTMRQHSNGKVIQPTSYLYYVDYVDTTGMVHRYEVDHWSPWLSGNLNDSVEIHVGDTVKLYHFSSQGIFDINGERVVFEKCGVFYE